MDHPVKLPPLDIPGLLRRHGLRPDKRLGQNFLIDDTALRRVVDAAGVGEDDLVLEIGAGLGSLTRYLAVIARRVVAVEIDSDLIPPLHEVVSPFSNVQLVEGDILQLQPSHLVDQSGYTVVANIPYYITSALIRHLLEASLRPDRLTLTVQKEVAERISAKPGDLSLLALSVQIYGEPRIADRIPAGAFYPAPKVDSAVVRVDLFPQPVFPPPVLDAFFRVAKAGFSQKRKTLRNALSGGLAMPAPAAEELLTNAGIDPRRRAETLSLEEWGEVARAYRQADGDTL